MKERLLILFFGFVVYISNAQPQKILDSLKQLLPANNDTLNLVYNRLISYTYEEINHDSAISYGMSYLKLPKKLNYKLNEAEALTRLSYDLQGSAKGLEMIFEAQQLVPQNNDEKLLPARYLQMLHVPENLQSYSKYKQHINGNLIFVRGTHYWANNENNKAYSYFLQTLKMGRSLPDYELLMLSYLAFGIITANNDSSLAYGKESYRIAQEKGLSREIGNIEGFLAQKYSYKKDYPAQVFYLKASIEHNIQQGRIITAGYSYLDLADYYRQNIVKEDSALFYGRKAFDLAQITDDYGLQHLAAKLFFEEYRNKNDKDSAFKYLDLMLEAKDKISSEDKARAFESAEFSKQLQEAALSAANEKFRNRLKMYGLFTGLIVFVLLAVIFWGNSKRRKKEYVLLENQKIQTDKALKELESTQAQLIQSEKMASLGELTAGIAHEIQNPLNFVNNFSEVNKEMIDELQTELKSGNVDEAINISNDIKNNEEKINHHGKRADAIVKGMLQHSRKSEGVKEPTDINALCDEYWRLSYHGMRAKDKNFNADFKTDFDEGIGKINIVPQDIGRVLLNLFNNAFYAVQEKAKQQPNGYKPTITLQTKKLSNTIELTVMDNGNGIPQKVVDKIFQPFFTTKPTGEGTGLGLSLAYDIITKEHNGTIKVESKESEFTEFVIQLPSAVKV